jgi:PHD/YefM family antitoxin component YafN of YafNO toxin-antitoxin module
MLGLSEARTKLFDLADESKPTLLLRHSSPRAVLVPYAAWVELQTEIDDLKGVVAGYRSRTNSPQLRLPTIDLERNARRLSEVLDLAEQLPHRPRRKVAYPPFLRRLH